MDYSASLGKEKRGNRDERAVNFPTSLSVSRLRTYLDPCGLSHHPGDGPEVVERPLRGHARRAVGVREDPEVGRVFRCCGRGK